MENRSIAESQVLWRSTATWLLRCTDLEVQKRPPEGGLGSAGI